MKYKHTHTEWCDVFSVPFSVLKKKLLTAIIICDCIWWQRWRNEITWRNKDYYENERSVSTTMMTTMDQMNEWMNESNEREREKKIPILVDAGPK